MATRPNRVWTTFFLLVGRHWPQGLLQHRTPQRRPQLVEFLFQGVKIRLLADAAQRVVLGGGQRQAGFFCHDQQKKRVIELQPRHVVLNYTRIIRATYLFPVGSMLNTVGLLVLNVWLAVMPKNKNGAAKSAFSPCLMK